MCGCECAGAGAGEGEDGSGGECEDDCYIKWQDASVCERMRMTLKVRE